MRACARQRKARQAQLCPAGGPSEKKLPIGVVVVDEKHDRKQMQSPPERAVRKPRH